MEYLLFALEMVFIIMKCLLLGLVLVFLLLPSVPIHELGHYLAIKKFGGKIEFVEFTSGKQKEYGKFSIGLKFWIGRVKWEETSIVSNKKKAFVALAGPLMDFGLSVLIFITCIFLYELDVLSISSFIFFSLLSFLYFIVFLANMIPNKKTKNDGYNFLTRLNLMQKKL